MLKKPIHPLLELSTWAIRESRIIVLICMVIDFVILRVSHEALLVSEELRIAAPFAFVHTQEWKISRPNNHRLSR